MSNLEIHTVNALSPYGGKRFGLIPDILYKLCTKSVRVPVFRGYQKPLHYSLHVPEEADVEAAKALDIMLLQKPAEQEKNISGKQKSRPEPEAAVYRVVKCR